MTGPKHPQVPRGTSAVTVEDDDGLVIVTLDDGKANALTEAVFEELEAALALATARQSAVVIRGRPGFLSAGLDLKVLQRGDQDAVDRLRAAGDRLFLTMVAAPIPVVVACTGHALAGGALLLLCADLRIGGPGDYRIGLAEVSAGVAVPPLLLDIARRRVASSRLLRSVVLAERWSPRDAVGAGFLDELVDGDLMTAARAAAIRLSQLPREAFASTKLLFSSDDRVLSDLG